MTATEIIQKAKFHAVLKLCHSKTFNDIEHYFDENMEEIAMIFCRNEPLESIHEFDPKRKWDPRLMEFCYEVKKLHEGYPV